MNICLFRVVCFQCGHRIPILFFCLFLFFPSNALSNQVKSDIQRTLFVSGAALSSNALYFYGGFRQKIGGHLDESGWIFHGQYGHGLYFYDNKTIQPDPIEAAFAILDAGVGYEFRASDRSLTLLAGFHGERHVLSAFDPGNSVQGDATGFAGQVDFWWKPKPDVLVTAFGSATNVYSGFYARLFTGWRADWLGGAFTGPELAVTGNRTYWEARLGMQVNGLKLAGWGASVSAGVALNQDSRSSLYSGLTLWKRYDLIGALNSCTSKSAYVCLSSILP